jgi:hypothetical protein
MTPLREAAAAVVSAYLGTPEGEELTFDVLIERLSAALAVQPQAERAGLNAVVYPPDGTVSPFTVINLGQGAVVMGDAIHDQRLPALWFGKDGKGMGHEEDLNREAKEGETLAVVTFSNVEGLDVLLQVVQRIRRLAFPAAPTAPAHEAPDWRMRVAAIAAECSDSDTTDALDKLLEEMPAHEADAGEAQR